MLLAYEQGVFSIQVDEKQIQMLISVLNLEIEEEIYEKNLMVIYLSLREIVAVKFHE